MQIEVKRSGGFAGITTTFLADEKLATPDEISQLEELVNKAKFFDLSSEPQAKRDGADYYTYEITVEMGLMRHTVKATDITISQSLRSIINQVMDIHYRTSHD